MSCRLLRVRPVLWRRLTRLWRRLDDERRHRLAVLVLEARTGLPVVFFVDDLEDDDVDALVERYVLGLVAVLLDRALLGGLHDFLAVEVNLCLVVAADQK